jgi:predicted site-specific integrase-resolvase
MAKKSELLTSAKFAKKTGLTTATVSKLIRDGKINAAKKSGKWMIEPDQLNAKAVKAALKSGKPAAKKKSSTPKPKKAPAKAKKAAAPKADIPAEPTKTFSIAEFAGMTYLTEKGVTEWLKIGRLKGSQDDRGAWRIDATNLEAPPIKRLVRDS